MLARDEVPRFLQGGGEMGALMRARDWAATAVGPPNAWPVSLRTIVRIMLTTNHPMFVFWGADLTCFYNDAYSRSIGPEKHPRALGAPGREVFPEIWDIIGPQIDLVMSGQGATWHENHLVPIERHGRREDVYWTYGYSPIDDSASSTGVGGVLVICTETTETVLAEMRKGHDLLEARTQLQETHHRVKNNLAAISAMLRFESRKLENKELQRPLERIDARLQGMAKLHEMMLRHEVADSLDAGRYLRDLTEEIDRIWAPSDKEITASIATEEIRLSTERAFHVAAITAELLSNAYTHAFHGRSRGAIALDLRALADRAILTVADDGIGINERHAQPSSTGVGIRLVEYYVDAMGGSLKQASDEAGTRIEISFPIEN